MKNISWDYYKDQSLRQHRNISFEEILLLIAEGYLVDILENRKPELPRAEDYAG